MLANRVLIGCTVKEKNLEYANLETEYLFRTINKFGGTLVDTKKIACFTEKPNSVLQEILENIQVQIKITSELDSRYAFANALLILEEGIKEDVDVIVMLDTDIVIANDFSDLLSTEKILIKPEDSDPFNLDDWQQLFDLFKVPFPEERFFTSCSRQETIPYFNGGVIIIPKIFAVKLLEQWKSFVKLILDRKSELPKIFIQNIRFTGQIAFSLALIKSKLPYAPLPLSMNYPYSGRVHPNENPEELEPFIIHHHHSIKENGDLMYCPYAKINSKIDEINDYLRKTSKLEIDNKDLTSPLSIRNLTVIHDFDTVLERIAKIPLDHPNPDLQYYLALSLHSTHQKLDEALIRYTKALELGFEPFWIFFNKCMLYIELGDLESAKNNLSKSVKHGSTPPNFYDVMIQTLHDRNYYLEQVIKDKDSYLEQVIKDKDSYLEQVIKDYKSQIHEIRNSKLWKILHKFDKNND